MIKLIDILLSEKIDMDKIFMKGVGPGGEYNPDQLTDEPEDPKYPKGKYIEITDKKELGAVKDVLYNLIKNAYESIGGNVKIKSPDSILDRSLTYWKVADLDSDPELDVVSFGKETDYGVKHTGIGHDGDKSNIKNLLTKKSKELNMTGNYVEISGPAHRAYVEVGGTPTVNDEDTVRAVLSGKDLEWHGKHPQDPSKGGNGWYTRKIGGKKLTKILAGIPAI